jgi:hypothetical protein
MKADGDDGTDSCLGRVVKDVSSSSARSRLACLLAARFPGSV